MIRDMIFIVWSVPAVSLRSLHFICLLADSCTTDMLLFTCADEH